MPIQTERRIEARDRVDGSARDRHGKTIARRAVVDAEEALRLRETEEGFDAIVSDIEMPELGGIELARTREPSNPVLTMALAKFYDDYAFTGVLDAELEKSNRERAIQTYKAYLQQDPNSAEAWIAIGRLLYRNKQWEEAADWFRHAMDRGWRVNTMILWYFECLFRLGQFKELRRAYPDYAVVGEEGGIQGQSRYTWVIDPLDGTTNFLHGIPQFCISIGLERSGTMVAGVIYNPVTDELYTAERGKGAFLNDKRIRVAARTRLIDTVIACGLPHHGRSDLELGLKELGAVQDKVAGLRRFGAAALDLAYVAAGRIDAYWEQNVSPWDLAAGIVLVREAGGYATDIDGGDAMFSKRNIVVGNESVHRELQKILKDAGKG